MLEGFMFWNFRRNNKLPFHLLPFLIERFPFSIPSIDKWHPFHPLPNLEVCISLNDNCQMHFLFNINTSQN